MPSKTVRKGLPGIKREPKVKQQLGIVIDTQCKEHAMIFPTNLNRPQMRARRGRSSKSKTPVPPAVEPPKKASIVDAIPVPTATVSETALDPQSLTPATPTTSRRGSFTRKKSEALGVLNKIEKSAHGSNSKGIANDIKRPKRKRLGDETEIAAENIPVEAVLPALQFGINKNMCPKKRRRLQSLMSPRTT